MERTRRRVTLMKGIVGRPKRWFERNLNPCSELAVPNMH
jgi:hypothetical protein